MSDRRDEEGAADMPRRSQGMVVRTDDNGACVIVRNGLTPQGAQDLAAEMTARGHKQSFDALFYDTPGERDEIISRLGAVV